MKYLKIFEKFKHNEDINPYIFDNPILVNAIENAIEKDGSSFICSYVASAVKNLVPNVKIYGFSADENPTSEYFKDDGDDGHHFAVLNNRYIIDPWIYNNYEDYKSKKTFNRSVFDLKNKNDNNIIQYIYGDKNNWIDITKGFDDFKILFPKTYQDLEDFYKSLF